MSMPAINNNNPSCYIAVAGFFLSLAAFFPGFMSPDSLSQYEISKSLVFTDWHPPVMSWVWSILNLFFQGPEGLLFFQLILLWLGLFVWYQLYKDKNYSWLILCIGFLPWVINFSGVLWKDVGMAFSLLLLAGIGIGDKTSPRLFVALALLFYAINLRYNAVFALVPILIMVASKWYGDYSILKRLVLISVTLSAVLTLGSVFNYKILNTSRTNPSNYMMVDDLFHLSLIKNMSLIPGIPFSDIQDCAVREIGQNKLVGKIFCLDTKESYRVANPLKINLKKIWLMEIIDSPIEYAMFRLAAFKYLLRSPSVDPYYIWHPGIDKNEMGIKQERNGATLFVNWAVQKASTAAPFLFKPYWWLWSSCLLFLLTLSIEATKSTRIQQTLLISSLLYIFSYIPATPMADFRYVYWSVIATSLAVVLLVIDRPILFLRKKSFHNIILLLIALSISVLFLNSQNVFNVNVDRMLLNSVLSNKRSVDVAPLSYYLTPVNGGYSIAGDDPQLIFDVTGMKLMASDIRFIGFDFSCIALNAQPQLQLFWWGGSQSIASEKQSVTINAYEGTNTFAVSSEKDWNSLAQVKGIRIDLVNPDACTSMKLEKLAVY